MFRVTGSVLRLKGCVDFQPAALDRCVFGLSRAVLAKSPKPLAVKPSKKAALQKPLSVKKASAGPAFGIKRSTSQIAQAAKAAQKPKAAHSKAVQRLRRTSGGSRAKLAKQRQLAAERARKANGKRSYVLQAPDGDSGHVFEGRKPGQAARKAASRGHTNIVLRQASTRKYYHYAGSVKTVPVPRALQQTWGKGLRALRVGVAKALKIERR
eukprot:NODE_3571_length_910_cov_6.447154_g2971_i0.p1 GENE.NODE_3571_length_910_cov_6.447154_g2971_i0~~NODE_3571_length_910_cov_6.447154_g2971_i0.p1  ORF type:complete len:211 (-),score=82.17 NODE_3571_length_910_cov_6.447154_g2971_i0:175-807(-)